MEYCNSYIQHRYNYTIWTSLLCGVACAEKTPPHAAERLLGLRDHASCSTPVRDCTTHISPGQHPRVHGQRASPTRAVDCLCARVCLPKSRPSAVVYQSKLPGVCTAPCSHGPEGCTGCTRWASSYARPRGPRVAWQQRRRPFHKLDCANAQTGSPCAPLRRAHRSHGWLITKPAAQPPCRSPAHAGARRPQRRGCRLRGVAMRRHECAASGEVRRSVRRLLGAVLGAWVGGSGRCRYHHATRSAAAERYLWR